MRTVAELAEREEAYGTGWGLPGSGPLTADRLAEITGALFFPEGLSFDGR